MFASLAESSPPWKVSVSRRASALGLEAFLVLRGRALPSRSARGGIKVAGEAVWLLLRMPSWENTFSIVMDELASDGGIRLMEGLLFLFHSPFT